MPYIKENLPFDKMHRLLKGYELDGPKLAAILGVSAPTAKLRLDEPGKLTLADLDKISRRGHIPMEELRECIVK